MTNPFHTIGHSTRTTDELVALLREAEVALVVDVRTVPRSRTNPQYNADVFPHALAERQIAYEHIAELGGLRGRKRDVPADLNAFWQNDSFHNYADYALGADFALGFARLRRLGHARRAAIMCAEAVWWRCHRRIIADYLIDAGEDVRHIMGPGKIEPAHLTAGARRDAAGHLVYPADPDAAQLNLALPTPPDEASS